MDYKQIIESAYNRKNWQELLHDIFGSRIKFYSPTRIEVNSETAQYAMYLGKIELADGNEIAIYEVKLSESVVIERNKVSIRNLLVSHWRNSGFAGAFMFCFKENESVLRFSYVSEIMAFKEDGKLGTKATDTKRFTYYLGKGHRSRTAIDQFTKLKGSGQTLEDITKAFSIEAVSDAFFAGYKNIYEDIVEYMTGKRMTKVGNKWEEVTISSGNPAIVKEFSVFDNPLKSMRDYAKKLMGRLVFLQFIQKKGWLGVKKNAIWGTGDKEFMFNLFTNSKQKEDFIEKVLEPLFNDINTQREGDLVSDRNVGLDIKVPFLNGGLFERDKEDETTIKLPARFFERLFDFFSQYNFTIDENDPNDTEVGVDPEMLGRIFENLLEDNKDKGAFYTPKEIVRYMCAESLIAYLQTDIANESDKENIRHFVSTHEVSFLNETLKPMVKQKLRDVKICDPAIGSGAFPIGLLNELFACFEALEGEQANRAEIKKHIIQNSIYGVDIEKGAVDIARLRFWLSLVVDEDKPDALPNLDFKIMQGNSLLEQYKTADLSRLVADKKIGMQRDIFDDELTDYRSNLNNLINEYFSTKEHSAKMELKRQIQRNVNEQMKAADIKLDFNALGIDVAGNDQFFLWHTWFADVFNRPNGCNGFDIVIGNPPYFQMKKGVVSKDKFPFSEGKDQGKQNIYKVFVELSYNLLKLNGVCSLITQSSLMCDASAQYTRELLLRNTTIHQVIEFPKVAPHPEGQLFKGALVATCITVFSKSTASEDHRFFLSANNDLTTLYRFDFAELKQTEPISFYPNGYCLPLIRKNDFPIIEKLNSGTTFLEEYISKSSQGDFNLTNERYCFSTTPSDVKMYRGCHIHRYYIDSITEEYIQNNHKSEYVSNNEKHDILVCQNISGMTDKMRFNVAISRRNRCLFGHTVNKLLLKEKTNTRFILALLNSKIMDWYFRKTSTNNHLNIYELEQLPIPSATLDQQKQIIGLVDRIISIKESNPQADISELEHAIDHLVYQLYGLTDDEIAIVENNA